MSRIKPEQEIKYICNVIDKNIEAHKILKDRGLLSENILAQLRNLTEDIAIFTTCERGVRQRGRERERETNIHRETVIYCLIYVYIFG